jgi:hypothetical protein
MEKVSYFTDKEYSSLKQKETLSPAQKKFIDVYENVYIMQGLSLLIAFPAIFYTRKAINYKTNLIRHNPNFTHEGYQRLARKMILSLSFGIALVINSEIHAYKNDFYALTDLISSKP